MTLDSSPMNTYGNGSVIAVANGMIYYATSGDYGDNGNTFLFGVSIIGGVSEFLASRFVA